MGQPNGGGATTGRPTYSRGWVERAVYENLPGRAAEVTRQVTEATGVYLDLVAWSLNEWVRSNGPDGGVPDYWPNYKAWAVPTLRLINATKCPECWNQGRGYRNEWAKRGWTITRNPTGVPSAVWVGAGEGNLWRCSSGDGQGGSCDHSVPQRSERDNTLNGLLAHAEPTRQPDRR